MKLKNQQRKQKHSEFVREPQFRRSESGKSSTKNRLRITNPDKSIVNSVTSSSYRRHITEISHKTKPLSSQEQILEDNNPSRHTEQNPPPVAPRSASICTTTANDDRKNHTNSIPSQSKASDFTTSHGLPSKRKLPPIPTVSSSSSDHQQLLLDNSNRSPRHQTPGICGLVNIGNTCFLNSAIQCLNSVPDLTKWIMQQPPPLTHMNVIDVYISLVQSMWSGRQSCVAPRELKQCVSRSAPIFSDYGQNDSHEFMNSLLNAIQNVDSNSFLVNLFRICTQSKTICNKHQHVDTTDEITTFLPLPLPLSQTKPDINVLLEDLIADFCQEDELSGQYYCQKCNVCLSARQKTSIIEPLPRALIIQLKRFPFDNTNKKVDTLVQYKLEHRNLLSNNDTYELCAVSMHSGDLAGGHYTTVARNHGTKKWYRFNDSSIQEIDSEKVLDPCNARQAYILIYLKQNE